MNKPKKAPSRVSEPIQVYLEPRDRVLLDGMAERSSQSRAEVIRIGIRRLAAETMGDKRTGASLDFLAGALDEADVPADLAARHDDYLYAPAKGKKPRARR